MENEDQPKNLLNQRDYEKGKKYCPDDEKYFLVDNIDWQHTESFVINDWATGSEHIQAAFGHLGKYDWKRVRT